MSVVVEKPYTFVPPHRGNLWPSLIQRLRLVDWYLRKKEGVVSYECRHLDRLRQSFAAGHGVLLAPNHCRYADPLVMGWLSRELGRHVYAMASWHLFNKGWFDRYAIPKMGGFSIWREGMDRQSLETAVSLLDEGKRPLIVFPEGTTNRINDRIQPMLEGVPFMARAAARRRSKAGRPSILIHPVGIKYVFRGDIRQWAEPAIGELESRLSWRHAPRLPLLQRLGRLAEGLLGLKEVEYLGKAQPGDYHERRLQLIDMLITTSEQRLGCPAAEQPVLNRVRACRARLVSELLAADTSEAAKEELRDWGARIDLTQTLVSYPEDYLSGQGVTDTRLLETIERLQEDFLGKSRSPAPLHAVMEVDEPIEVDDQRPPRGQPDPLLNAMRERLTAMIERLSEEANPYRE